jgi:hypothetical protein
MIKLCLKPEGTGGQVMNQKTDGLTTRLGVLAFIVGIGAKSVQFLVGRRS